MNGAEALVATAVTAGVEICFANPGTTELPLEMALDSVPGLRGILCLHENVATGAADGWEDGGEAGHVPASLGSGSRQRPNKPAQRPSRFYAAAECYRRSRYLAPASRSVAGDRRRIVGPHGQ